MSIRADNRHLYLQVIDKIKQNIEKGIFKEKERLPSEFDLSKQLGVSRATLREALRILEEENIIVRRHGVGTFVNTKPTFLSGIEQLNSITHMIEQAGMKAGTIFLSSQIQELSENDLTRFACGEDEQILFVERVRTANGEPVVYCMDKVPQKILPENFEYKQESLLEILEKQAGKHISYAVANIEPLGYHEKVSPILQCEPETALLVLKQMHYDQYDEPILYSINYFKADQFSFQVLRKRV
ncbi:MULTISPECIES: GntR family transcriptional regulator [Priestia]|jgi:GntR family transcriptional regulator|uniref:GntR family transcriptional regulator n=4 Tax=Priestia TaxID=2800373 RepID=A0AA86I322_PRIMG|nr:MULTISPECIES: GntR family transcriptional regulator [Priestia]KRD89763.1 GntR family transcriptional regulator [Bacillus sp. Root147]KRE05397.1 GntR family transcriptional regulator [Bacillus sp. Root239]MBK0008288.1 GntR family transcriptional regulator [Bacillus sp. S35]MBK0295295.1 GntR family transcriptional regulator [Bacillus sp. S34]MCL9636338.1 GntR family transcriptional regulator [Bacillus zanthoxyli]NHH92623.1 HTH-type transcriptional repressor YvoA [Bacillus sp. MB95]UPK51112.